MKSIPSIDASILAFLSFCLWVTCTSNPPDISGTLETTNGVGLVSTDPEGNPLGNVEAELVALEIRPDGPKIIKLYTARSDQSGRIVFHDVPAGRYTLKCTSDSLETVVSRINKTDSAFTFTSPVVLNQSIVMKGRLLLDDPAMTDSVLVTIPGTSKFASVDSSGFFTFSDLPVGSYDLTIINGDVINYLVLSIESSLQDTAYLPDISLFHCPGTDAVPYSFFDHSLESAYCVAPRKYKPSNEPEWYKDKDFSRLTIYSSIDDSLVFISREARQILFISRESSAKDPDDLAAIKRAEVMGKTVFFKGQSELTTADTSGMDLVYISFHIESSTFPSWLSQIPKPMIVGEPQLYSLMNMTESAGRTLDPSNLNLVITLPDHPVAAGLSGTVSPITLSQGNVGFGIPPETATIVAVSESQPEKALLFVYEAGDAMAGSYLAPARRIGYYGKTNAFAYATDEGWRIFDAAIDWALAE